MRQLYQIWERRLPQEVCDAVVAMALELPPQQGVIGHGGKAVVRTETRRSTIRWIHRDRPEWDYLWRTIDYILQQGNRNAFDFVIDPPGPLSLQFTEYVYAPGEEGHYDWHEDLFWVCEKEPKQRKLSLVVNLSDPNDYDGGVLEIEEAVVDEQKLRNRGTAILFPSFLRHRVTPVTRGKRYSLVGWAEGPPFR